MFYLFILIFYYKSQTQLYYTINSDNTHQIQIHKQNNCYYIVTSLYNKIIHNIHIPHHRNIYTNKFCKFIVSAILYNTGATQAFLFTKKRKEKKSTIVHSTIHNCPKISFVIQSLSIRAPNCTPSQVYSQLYSIRKKIHIRMIMKHKRKHTINDSLSMLIYI